MKNKHVIFAFQNIALLLIILKQLSQKLDNFQSEAIN